MQMYVHITHKYQQSQPRNTLPSTPAYGIMQQWYLLKNKHACVCTYNTVGLFVNGKSFQHKIFEENIVTQYVAKWTIVVPLPWGKTCVAMVQAGGL